MIDKCFHCGFSFEETSVQANRRRKNNTEKTCSTCQRIHNAEANAAKRLALKNRSLEERMMSDLYPYKKKYGKITPTLIMRKYRVDYEESFNLWTKLFDNNNNENVNQKFYS